MDVDLTGGSGTGSPAPSGTAPAKRRPLFAILASFVMWPFFIGLWAFLPAMCGFEEPMLRAIEACPAAAAALGTPVTRSYLGMSCGNAEIEDSNGNASWSFPVAGPNGSGTVDMTARMRGGPWEVMSATLETSTGTWDVVNCVGGGGFTVVASHFDATASVTVGAPPVADGAACTIDLGPGDGPFPCHLNIACGDTTLYGGGSQGFAHCSPDTRGALTVHDPTPTASDGDPTLDLRIGDGQAILTDANASGTWVLALSFTPPAGLATPEPPPMDPPPAAPPPAAPMPTSGVVSPTPPAATPEPPP